MDKPLPAWTTQTWHSFVNFLKPSSLLYIALLPSLAFTLFLCYGFSPLLVSIPVLLVFISSIFSKGKVVAAAIEVEEEEEEEEEEAGAVEKPSQGSETIDDVVVVPELCEVKRRDDGACELHEYQVESTEFPSDGESTSDDSARSEIFELKWMKPFNNVSQSLAFCESSASDYDGEVEDDDDDLIEISLPPIESSIYADEVSSMGMVSWEKPVISNEFVIREKEEEGMMEVVEEIDEVNEEDNLIEIDLSIGSIKSSSFDMEDR